MKLNGRWEHVGRVDCNRDYELFGKLAGVRNSSIKPISSPKGFPDDINPLTKWYLNQEEEHSFSWLDGKELKKLAKWEEKEQRFERLSDRLNDFWNAKILYTKDYRVVFGFDS